MYSHEQAGLATRLAVLGIRLLGWLGEALDEAVRVAGAFGGRPWSFSPSPGYGHQRQRGQDEDMVGRHEGVVVTSGSGGEWREQAGGGGADEER